MLRDFALHTTSQGTADLSIDNMHSISVLLSLIDGRIGNFPDYYFKVDKAEKENHISFHLVNYFNAQLIDAEDGYLPYNFSFVKNPPQSGSSKETDIGVVILNPSAPSRTIFEFESKRLSDSSNNREYVYGKRGGIERFKREEHAAHLTICGMFAYVQHKTIAHWLEKINGWITDLGANNTDTSINWKPDEEKLVTIQGCPIDKCQSSNLRTKQPIIKLYHYFINLVP